MEINVNEARGETQFFGEHEGNFFQVTFRRRLKSAYIFSVLGSGSRKLQVPVFSKLIQLLREKKCGKVTVDVLLDEKGKGKLLKHALAAGFKPTRWRALLKIPYAGKIEALPTLPMHATVDELEARLRKIVEQQKRNMRLEWGRGGE